MLTEYDIEVSSDSNVYVDFCTKAGHPLEDPNFPDNEIPLDPNYAWDDDETNSEFVPALPGTAMTTSYVKGVTNIAPGGLNYYRFWLDVDAGQPTGTYNNTIWFEGVQTGTTGPDCVLL